MLIGSVDSVVCYTGSVDSVVRYTGSVDSVVCYTGWFLGLKLFVIDPVYNRFPRIKEKYDTASGRTCWQMLSWRSTHSVTPTTRFGWR